MLAAARARSYALRAPPSPSETRGLGLTGGRGAGSQSADAAALAPWAQGDEWATRSACSRARAARGGRRRRGRARPGPGVRLQDNADRLRRAETEDRHPALRVPQPDWRDARQKAVPARPAGVLVSPRAGRS